MPKRSDVKKVLVIGSGPIIIGQAAEFDYAGAQACRALKEEGLEVVLVNSNPATIMTDKTMADKIYIEPLTVEVVKRIIDIERPDSVLANMGGQTGLNIGMELSEGDFLPSRGVRLLGVNPETIRKAEDRQAFKDTMLSIGEPCIPSKVVESVEDALAFAHEIDYPVVVRPAYTLGGTGGGFVHNDEEMHEICAGGLRASLIHQVLIEKSVAGWKEIEFEVIRDGAGNAIDVCSMENIDPVGVHTGDSIVVAPAQTMSAHEFRMMRAAALNIVTALGVEGGCNVQFALKPDSMEYAVIEVNPRVSRSSALASKATGYPIAKVACKIAIGYRLDEIVNAVTGKTYACNEPAVDYCVIKFPKWPFDKFVYADRRLGTQMKATGEVMSIGSGFEIAFMKAVRSIELGIDTPNLPKLDKNTDEEIREIIARQDDERIFAIYAALKRRIMTPAEIYELTKIDRWFLSKLNRLVAMEAELSSAELDEETYLRAKRLGFLDKTIRRLTGQELPAERHAAYKMVDTCAAEFDAETPYFYSSWDDENEAALYNAALNSDKKRIIVFGSGPIRIGQGIEFDYCSVHCVRTLKKLGYEAIIANNNPETVSTDFDTADRLYFDPLTPEDVDNVLATERPDAVVVQFGGQTAIKLTKHLEAKGVKILGTPADSIDAAEDRERFDELLEELHIKRPEGFTVMTTAEALEVAEKIGYPVLLRPSYVLGGQNMIIAFTPADVKEYMAIILAQDIENPILIDKYLMGTELEVDAICDGEDILIPGIMEHIERAGIHSGDSIAVYPAWNIDDGRRAQIVDCSRRLAVSLKTRGLVNIQYLIYEDKLYVIEVNPRSSRTIPYISKVTGVPMVDLATRAMLGEKLRDMGYGTGLYRTSPYVAVKVPVFSFEKLINVDTHLGPEMKSTGEVLGIANTLDEALYKGLIAAGYKLHREGGVFFTVRDSDKAEIADTAKKYHELGFALYATAGTAAVLRRRGLPVTVVAKIHESGDNPLTLLESGKIHYIVSTSSKGRIPTLDDVKIRRKAVERSIPCLTSIDTAGAVADSIRSRWTPTCTELVDVNHLRAGKVRLAFTKMEGCGNDYIYFNCFDQKIDNPEGLSIRLADRHKGIGGDGAVLICPSDVADARMRMFNLDGSEGRMCGNAIHCVGKYLYDNGIRVKEEMDIETLSGIRHLTLHKYNGAVRRVTVDMGAAELRPALIPVASEKERVVDEPAFLAGEERRITCVSMGNPHCVLFCEEPDVVDVEGVGSRIEADPLFPERVNVEFIAVLDSHTLKMRVWERGSGETWACGTGACAAAVAAVENGYCPKGEEITVKLRGGDLVIRYTGETVFMTGAAEKVFDGTVEL